MGAARRICTDEQILNATQNPPQNTRAKGRAEDDEALEQQRDQPGALPLGLVEAGQADRALAQAAHAYRLLPGAETRSALWQAGVALRLRETLAVGGQACRPVAGEVGGDEDAAHAHMILRTSGSGRCRIALPSGTHGHAGTSALAFSFSMASTMARTPVWVSTMKGVFLTRSFSQTTDEATMDLPGSPTMRCSSRKASPSPKGARLAR